MPTYEPLAAANAFIALSNEAGVSHMRLQKLVYIALGNWLRTHEDTFLSENPQVWQYGPVFEELYHDLKEFKAQPIKQVQTLYGVESELPAGAEQERNIINAVWGKFGKWTGAQLSDLTHLPGSPWFQIAKKFDFSVPPKTEIDPALIKKYFRGSTPLAV